MGDSELHEYCQDGDVESVREFIQFAKAGFDINQYENWKWRYTPLGIACKKGHAQVVKTLLSHPDIDKEKGWVGEWGLTRTPLEIAASQGSDEIVKILLEKEVQVTSKAFLNYVKYVQRYKRLNKLTEEPEEPKPVKQEAPVDTEKEQLSRDNAKHVREISRLNGELSVLRDKCARLERPRAPEVREVVKEVEVIKKVPVEVIKEVIKEVKVPVEVIKEVIKEVKVEVIKEVAGSHSLAKYENQPWIGEPVQALDDVLKLTKHRAGLFEQVERVVDLVRQYQGSSAAPASASQPSVRPVARAVNTRDDLNLISNTHDAWQSKVHSSIKQFLAGALPSNSPQVTQIIAEVNSDQESCLKYIQDFYSKLAELEAANSAAPSEDPSAKNLQTRVQLLGELSNAAKSFSKEFNVALDAKKPSVKDAELPASLQQELQHWSSWFTAYKSSASLVALSEVIKSSDGVHSASQKLLDSLRNESNLFSELIGDGLVQVNVNHFPLIPKRIAEFVQNISAWVEVAQVKITEKPAAPSGDETSRQQQAREQARSRVAVIETQIKQFREEAEEIKQLLTTLQQLKISEKRLLSQQSREESKIFDLEINLEEVTLGGSEFTEDEIKQQITDARANIESLKSKRAANLEQRRTIQGQLRNLALRGHVSVLANSDIFDIQGVCNELLRGGLESRFLAGENINDYEQIETLSMRVAKYQHKQDPNKIFVMKKYDIMDAQQVKFFRNELKLLHKIQHPFIGGVNGVIFSQSEAYIQLPFHKGGSLQDKFSAIRQRRAQPDYSTGQEQGDYHLIKKIFHELLQALAYLHSNSITHNNIKPENVVFDEYDHPILIDFGFGQDPNSTLFTKNKEEARGLHGNSVYAAPEVKAGEDATLTPDCWAFGVMLFEAFFDPKDHDLGALGLVEIPKHNDENLRQLLLGFLKTDSTKRFTATQGLKSNFFKQDAYEKLLMENQIVQSAKKLEAFRQFLTVVRNKDRLLVLNIKRDQLVKDIFTEFRNKCRDPIQMKYQTVVQYIGEKGIDTGGLRRDLYYNFFQEICDPKYGMFDLNSDGKFYYPSVDSEQKLDEQYFLFGKILAKTLIDGDVIGDHFPMSLFKFLIGQEDSIDLTDVYQYDKQIYGNLQSLLMQSIDDWDLDWDIDFNPHKYEVITDRNKDFYILHKSRHVLIESRRRALNSIRQGFESLRELQAHLALLSPVELRLLLSGETYIDGEMVLQQFQFEDRWNERDCRACRENLAQWIRNAAADQLKLLLMLTTASPTIPVGGFSPPIKVRYVPETSRLPEGQTCVNMLLMPNYGDDAVLLAKRMATALENLESSGFQMN